MPPRLFANFFQHGYITNDMARAKRVFADTHNVRDYVDIDNAFEVNTPAGVKTLDLKISLAYVDELQVELIEPVGGSAADLYRQVLPASDFAIVIHHMAYMITGPEENWHAFRRQVGNPTYPIAIEAEIGPVKFLYLDTRKTTGHYSEYLWASEDINAMVPRN
ncbi:MAG: hypothetical protein CMK32_09490 [Porticoccaceae bacterium]|nr:hypothetical protein [Porticoccaceae bacterium]